MGNTRSDNDFTLAGCHDSVSSRGNQHYLMKDGEIHEISSRSRAEFSNNCYGNNYDCHYDYHLHEANGEVQFFRPEFECNQP